MRLKSQAESYFCRPQGCARRSSRIRADDRRFRALVEDLPAITYIADFVGTFTLRYVSPQIEQVLGLPAGRVDRRRDRLGRARCIRTTATASSPRPRRASRPSMPFDFEYRMFSADGRELWIWEKTAIQRDADGRPVAVNGVMLDVTELRTDAGGAAAGSRPPRAGARALRDRAAPPGRRAPPPRAARRADRAAEPPPPLRAAPDADRRHRSRATASRCCSWTSTASRRSTTSSDIRAATSCSARSRERFAREVRDEDLLARLGGDEFAVLVGRPRRRRRARDRAPAEPRAGARVRAQRRPGPRRGVDRHRPLSARRTDATALLRCADSAMYAAKDLSTELELFDDERDHHSPTRLKRLGELRQALTPRGARAPLSAEAAARDRRRSSAPRHSFAGSTPSTGCFRRVSSSRSPSRPG